MTRPPGAARVHTWKGAAAVTLSAGDLEATFLPDVGLLGASLRHRGEELLALPGGLRRYRERHQAGLPFLAPWANRVDGWRYTAAGIDVDLAGLPLTTDDGGLPIHGTMTAQPGWEIASLEPGRLVAWFDYGARPDLLAAFPFPHRIEVDARVEPGALHVTTTVEATADRPVPVAFGWHPYLRLPGAPRRSWELVVPACRHLLLDRRGIPTGASEPWPAEQLPIGTRTFDDLFALDAGRELALHGGGRRIAVEYGDGYDHAQVFVPPGQAFACLEPMTAPTNALGDGSYPVAEPGSRFRARFAIRVSDQP